MNTRAMSAASGALIMWVLAIAWWLGTDRSLAPTVGALAIGVLGTGIAAAGARKPVPSRRRALLAAGVAALIALGLAIIVRQ